MSPCCEETSDRMNPKYTQKIPECSKFHKLGFPRNDLLDSFYFLHEINHEWKVTDPLLEGKCKQPQMNQYKTKIRSLLVCLCICYYIPLDC